MELLLYVNALLLGTALLQALIGILFFRHGPALVVFFLQTFFLTWSTVLLVGFAFEARHLCAWICVVLYIYLAIIGLRHWKKKEAQKLS